MRARCCFLALLFVVLSLLVIVQVRAADFSWREDFNYGSLEEMQAAGWQFGNPNGTRLEYGHVILDGTQADTSINYVNHFPEGISDWTIEIRTLWLGQGHSQPAIYLSTDRHGYGFTADGWYSVFGFRRDDASAITFGSYAEQAMVYVTLRMEKQGNTLRMYYNGGLVQTYTEQDTVPSYLTGVSTISPWRGDQEYDYYYVTSSNGSSVLSGNEVWCPTSTTMGIAAPVISFVMFGVVSLLMGAITIPVASISNGLARATAKAKDLIPNAIKSWLEDFLASRRKLGVDEKKGSPFIPTKPELLVYLVSVIVIALSFAYAKVDDLSLILTVLPVIFATSILVGLAKAVSLIAFARSKGVWTERKFWYMGAATFVVTTLAFKMPFSTPARSVSFKPKMTDRLRGILACCEIFISLAFAAFFFVLFLSGLTLIGSTGLAMCIIGAFFDTFPIEPMNGKTIYDFKKLIWVALFFLTLGFYVVWLLLI